MELTPLNETLDFLIAAGRENDCADVIRPLTASRKASMEILVWLCRHVDTMAAWRVARPAELLTQVVDAFADDCGYAALKAQNALRELVEQRGWLEDMLGRLDRRQRHDFLKKVSVAPGWDPASRRSVMARMIKLYPELTRVVAGEQEPEEARGAAPQGRFTSTRSYRERQEALRKLVEEEIPKNSREIGVARSYGDLRENSEYKFAKEHQRLLMQRQAEMEQDLKTVAATDFNGFPTDKAGPGTCVTVRRPDGVVDRYSILGEWDGDVAAGIVSNLSQMAKVLTGRQAGDDVVEAVHRLGSRIHCVHFRDADTLGGPCVEMLLGKGKVPFAAVAKALREIGYRGPVHCEHFGSFAGERHGEVTAAWAAGFMRALLGPQG
jgi:transcription elongation GreA/GreB family factor